MAGTRLRLAVAVVLTSALLLGCSPPEDSPPAEETLAAGSVTSPDTPASTTEGPALSDALKRDCQRDPASAGPGRGGLSTGQTAVDFTLKDVNGREFSLSALLAKKPVVMVFGSFTWPPFRQRCAAYDDLYTEFGDRLHLIVIYTVEAHPAGSPSPYSGQEWTAAYSNDEAGNPVAQPQTYEERADLARKTVAAEEMTVPVLVDEMDDPVWCTYGAAPNAAYLIGTDGTVVARQAWFDPGEMESAILAYLSSR